MPTPPSSTREQDGRRVAKLTLSAAPAAAEGRHQLTVTAASGALEDEATLELEVASLTVRGRVTGTYGYPLVHVPVASQGDSEVSDLNGEFELTGLAVPYDVTMWDAANGSYFAFEGLTASEVVLGTNVTPNGAFSRSTTVKGTLTPQPVGPNDFVLVCPEGLDGPALGCFTYTSLDTEFTVPVAWVGPTNRQLRLHLLGVQSDDGATPDGYTGYATVDADLAHGVPAELDETVDLGDPLQTRTVDVQVESSDPVSIVISGLRLAPGLTVSVGAVAGTSSVSSTVPVIPGASYSFLAGTGGGLAWVADVTEDAVSFAIPDVPSLESPPSGVEGVTLDTEFEVTGAGDAALLWNWSAVGPTYQLSRTTVDPSTTMPDGSEAGMALPAATSFAWQAVSVGDGAEGAASAVYNLNAFLALILSSGSTGFVGDGHYVIAGSDTFTTAP